MMQVFVLYRPDVSSGAPRAQSVQVISSAHALAARGHQVELWTEGVGRPAEVLATYGLEPVPGLRLRVVRFGRTAASIAYRCGFAAWVARTRGRGVAVARRKRHADWALSTFGRRFRLVLEVHEVDSRQAEERGEDPAPHFALERRVLAGSAGVIANAEGTLALLREVHREVPPAIVAHNAARPAMPPSPSASGIGVVGSVRPYKDPETVARAAALGAPTLRWVGAGDAPHLVAAGAGRLVTSPGVPYRDVPAVLSGFRVLLVPLSPGTFGERLTSPLKLWDALQSGVPVVAADTPAVRSAAGDAVALYRPGDAHSLRDTLARVHDDEALRAELVARARVRARTWGQRAAEVEAFLGACGV
jgi:glycosyltransferase involved in cell wall biosynthesis